MNSLILLSSDLNKKNPQEHFVLLLNQRFRKFWPILETGAHCFFFDMVARAGLIRWPWYEHTESRAAVH